MMFVEVHGTTEEAPAGHRALNAESDAIGEAERVRWLEQLSEPQMAHLLRDDEVAFEARCVEAGRGMFT